LSKIIDHCNDSLPNLATGQLLGADFAGELEVSNCFPFPLESVDENSAPVDGMSIYTLNIIFAYTRKFSG
jgi:hypothetical protein